MRKILYTVTLVALLLGALAAVALADGTETFSDPLVITIATGSGVVTSGVGLVAQPGDININVPGTVNQALLYWSGAVTSNAASDDTVLVDGVEVSGTLIGGPAYFFDAFGKQFYYSSYRADITDMVNSGANVFTIEGMDNVDGSGHGENSGAGVLVIYDDGTSADIGIKDGMDLAYYDFPEPRKTTIVQTFTFAPEAVDRVADLNIFATSVGSTELRPTNIKVTAGGVTTDNFNVLNSHDGDLWDSISLPVAIPAGADFAEVQVLSEGPGGAPASLGWIGAALSVTKEEDGEGCSLTQGYWKTHSAYGPAPYDATWAQIGEDADFYLSGQSYYDVLWTQPKKGNAYYILAHQFIAAELNVLNGTSVPSQVAAALADAEALFMTYTPDEVVSS